MEASLAVLNRSTVCGIVLRVQQPGYRRRVCGRYSKAARKVCPSDLLATAKRKLDALNAAADIRDLRVPPGNRLEALHGDREGQYSIRLNDQFRVCFVWTEQGAAEIEIVDYH
jgi:proteic killer suppression protein